MHQGRFHSGVVKKLWQAECAGHPPGPAQCAFGRPARVLQSRSLEGSQLLRLIAVRRQRVRARFVVPALYRGDMAISIEAPSPLSRRRAHLIATEFRQSEEVDEALRQVVDVPGPCG